MPLQQKGADLTGFAALIGESFQARVDLLEKLLQTRHYPSLGNYKERLLANAIKQYLPKTVSVGTGFVLFPCEAGVKLSESEYFDELNQSAFDVSKQCDILVYDSQSHPPVFQDGDFVVLRPEAVKAVVEVKGNATDAEVRSGLTYFLDFAEKWQKTQRFYRDHSQMRCDDPQLHLFCWKAPVRRRKAIGKILRNKVSEFYKERVTLDRFGAFPLLHSLMVYNECEVSEMQGITAKPDRYQVGWYSRVGKFVRLDERGAPYLDRDRTVSSLLSKLHWAVGNENFNRFFSYADEVRSRGLEGLEESGITWTWETKDVGPISRHNKCELPS